MPRSPFSGSPLPPDAGPTLADALWDAVRHPDPVESQHLVDALLTRSASARAALRTRGIDVDRIIRTMGENRPSDAIDRATLTLVDARASDAHRRVALDILCHAFTRWPYARAARTVLGRLATERGKPPADVLRRDIVPSAVLLAIGDIDRPSHVRVGRQVVRVDDGCDYVRPIAPSVLRAPWFGPWLRQRVAYHVERIILSDDPDEPTRQAALSAKRRDERRETRASTPRRSPSWGPPTLDDAVPDLAADPRLTDIQRRVLALRADGRSATEIAIALGLRRNTVNQHIVRATRRLAR
jgi:hypothetical protein